jgi:hypothetical protein
MQRHPEKNSLEQSTVGLAVRRTEVGLHMNLVN